MAYSDLDVGAPVSAAVLDALASSGERLARTGSLDEALGEIARAAAEAVDAELVVLRVLDPDGFLRARAVAAASQALAAELEGSRYTLPPPSAGGDGVAEALSAGVARTAERLGSETGLVVPVLAAAGPVGSLELYRERKPLGAVDRRAARLAAAQAALAIRAFGASNGVLGTKAPSHSLDLVGDALAAGLEQAGTADQIARLAADATGAVSATIWDGEGLEPLATHGLPPSEPDREAALRALADSRSVIADGSLATVALGRPPFGALQLRFSADAVPVEAELERLASFGVRAAHALRLSERSERLAGDLERTQALLAVLGQAIARLSLSHTLETAVDRVAALLGVERVAVYLRDEEGRLTSLRNAASRGRTSRSPRVSSSSPRGRSAPAGRSRSTTRRSTCDWPTSPRRAAPPGSRRPSPCRCSSPRS